MSHAQEPLPEEGRASPKADAGPMRGPESRHRRAVDERRHEIGHQVPEMHGTPPFSRMGVREIPCVTEKMEQSSSGLASAGTDGPADQLSQGLV